jgi:hypothetical protein
LPSVTSTPSRIAVVCSSVAIGGALVLGVAASPPDRRAWALLLVIATTVLTVSSVVGYFFLRLFFGHAVSFGATLRGRAIALVLAAVAFGLSFGSGALLSYLLRHS